MRKYTLILISIFCSVVWHTRAADIKSIGVPYVQNYTKNIYQSGNQNWSVTRDEHGIMYFGNAEGLLSFDGKYWQQHHMPNGLIVRSVSADGRGKIYAGAFGEFGYWQDNNKGFLKYNSLINLVPKKYRPITEEIWKIYVDGDRVIFQSFGAIFIYSNGSIKVIKTPKPYLFLFKADKRFFIEQLTVGLFELKNNHLEYVQGSNVLGNSGVLSILPFQGNKYIIGTAKNGLFIYDGQSIKPWTNQANDFLKTYQLNNGAFIPGKYFAYGTILNGIVIIDTAGNVVQHINKLSGLQNNTVLSLYTDSEQNLWAGLDNGIDRIEVNSPLYFYFDKTGRFGTVYASIIFNNKIYLGTNQGLFYSDWIPDNKKLFQSFDFKLIPGSQGQVWDLSLQDGRLLCGHNDGTYQVNGNAITKISTATGGWTIKKLGRDMLIQGTYTGLVIYKKNASGNWIFSHKIDGFGEPSRYVVQDSKGQIWVSHAYKGIYKLTLSSDLKKVTSKIYYNERYGLPGSYNVNVFDLDNRVVFSSDSGFYIYDDITDRFFKYTQLNKKLGSFSASGKIIKAIGKKFWFINQGHVALTDLSVPGKLSIDTNSFTVLNGQMVQHYETINRINNSTYLISIDDGFVILNDGDSQLPNQIKIPQVLICRVENVTDKVSVISDINSEHNLIEIPYARNNIRIAYSLPYYKQAKIKFQYYLEGYSRQWSDWAPQSEKEFTNLDQGTYHFKVRAKINDQNISAISTLTFTVLPPWYAGKPAMVFYTLLLILAYYLIRHYYRFKLKRHQQHLHEKMQKEKEEFLKQEAIANEQHIINIKNEQLQADLASKSRELANSAMNLVYKNELLQKISEEIIHLKDNTGKKLADDQLRRIQKVIDEGMNDERDWNIFEKSFNEAHENFFKKLKSDHPDLVPNDLKLCAYLRMNMSSKEMASLLNISLRGVEIRRYRLRKKLNLEHDKNLVEFLIEL
ncbi:triple tyrosine motif-containing protein [Mucilaginibacter pocheonensis]|uniref:Ligand-binding sensor domain-containing protein/DNA-binding CsgD family transcriptional regulator n=1 Tax=Mucilaginibacter pocheonensis TaxID=398050 RepID=A0ABU1T8P3_9SPHI|nr:triple tyrosine motif-containing protein [Mucilaginibacter pocheonensis]MDR6941600.1 ligand-binding sensor domain-containing protein/DNA-binding CsgD family transcriptional regulator [Mucilaginibacter pocheonensis]